MAKKTNQEIADAAFNANKDLNEVFVTSDGYPFATVNAANLHKNTSGKKGIKVFPFTRKEDVKKPKTENTDPAPVKLDKLNKVDLIKAAESLGIRPEEKDTKAVIISMIETVKANTKE